MVYANVSIHFYLKADAYYASGELPVYCRITYQRKKAEVFTGEKCLPGRWNSDAGVPIRDQRLKEYLNHIEETIRQTKRQLETEGKDISAKILKDIFRGKDQKAEEENSILLVDYFDAYIRRISKLTSDYSTSTLKNYRTTLIHLRAFLKSKHLSGALQEIDHKFIDAFDYFLMTTPMPKTGEPLARNSANKYHTKLKTVLLQAVKEGLLPVSPYASFKLKNKTVHRDHLTQDELQRLRALKFENKSLDKVRDIFLFSCYTGLRFADGQSLRSQDVRSDQEGNMWIYLNQQKTDEPLAIPMLKPAQEIYHKYEQLREITGRIIPSLVNQKVNAYLKVLADLANIKKKLTHHVARHTFATTVLLENDVPLEAVQAYLGHTSAKTTAIYARMTNKYKMKIAHRLNSKLDL